MRCGTETAYIASAAILRIHNQASLLNLIEPDPIGETSPLVQEAATILLVFMPRVGAPLTYFLWGKGVYGLALTIEELQTSNYHN